MNRASPAAALALAVTATLAATPARSHPHEFIDAHVEILFDTDGQAGAIRIRWVYDDFVSLSIVTDRGLDPDGDGVLTPAEQAALNGFDMEWDPGYPGDSYADWNGTSPALGPPTGWTTGYENGRIVSSHVRWMTPAVDPAMAPLTIRIYDPSYYRDYTIMEDLATTGRNACRAAIVLPDLTEADRLLQAGLLNYAPDENPEDDFPEVGAAFATAVEVTCAKPS